MILAGNRIRRAGERLSESWRASLQVRFVGTVLIVSTVVMMVLGFTLASVVSQRIAQAKIDAANIEIDRARLVVEEQLETTSSTSSLQARLNSARASLTQRTQQGSDVANVYEPVLLVRSTLGVTTSSPELYLSLIHISEPTRPY